MLSRIFKTDTPTDFAQLLVAPAPDPDLERAVVATAEAESARREAENGLFELENRSTIRGTLSTERLAQIREERGAEIARLIEIEGRERARLSALRAAYAAQVSEVVTDEIIASYARAVAAKLAEVDDLLAIATTLESRLTELNVPVPDGATTGAKTLRAMLVPLARTWEKVAACAR